MKHEELTARIVKGMRAAQDLTAITGSDRWAGYERAMQDVLAMLADSNMPEDYLTAIGNIRERVENWEDYAMLPRIKREAN